MSHRTQITLTTQQYGRLRKESKRTGRSLADLVRRAVDAVYGEPEVSDKLEALRATAGLWRDRDFTGEEYVDQIRHGKRMSEGD